MAKKKMKLSSLSNVPARTFAGDFDVVAEARIHTVSIQSVTAEARLIHSENGIVDQDDDL